MESKYSARGTHYTDNGMYTSEITAVLRFVERDGQRVLQQAWKCVGGEGIWHEWKDVPVMSEDAQP